MLKQALAVALAAFVANAQDDFVQKLNEVPSPERLWAWHDMVASVPHIAGTPGDWHVINELARTFDDMGFEVDIHEFWPLLSYPVSAEVEVLHPSVEPGTGLLPLQEVPLREDEFSTDPSLTIGFNAYSGSGEAIGEVVYANFGRKEDFEKLAEMGIDCTGKIVLARYGGNYRGYKAKFAEEAGAAGVLIYLDPGDSGYVRGEVYPTGGWQTDSCIQRGSINTLPYKGDPLTPFVEATEDAERLDPAEIGLPKIPVQPIGWGAARQVFLRMEGPEAPEAWRGGLPMSYPITGGSDLRVRVNVQQDRRIVKTANVIARMEGELYPDQWVIVGCHHDAWGFGACDPTCGLISMLECARSFSELAASGRRPARTIIFCGWGAEEFGIIGSSEWVEANYDELRRKAVAYINLDMASMGPNFRASASPGMRQLVEDSARLVPQARAADKTVYDDWLARTARSDDPTKPSIGDLGGGSDHVAFVCHAGIPGISIGCGGSAGTAYHTAYDNLNWYRQVVGDDYEPALMIARMTNALAGELAFAERLPFDASGTATYVAEQVSSLRENAALVDAVGEEAIDGLIRLASERAEQWRRVPVETTEAFAAIGSLEYIALLLERRLFFDEAGVGGRDWYRSEIVATNPDSGYGTWPLPGVRAAIESGDAEAMRSEIERLHLALEQWR